MHEAGAMGTRTGDSARETAKAHSPYLPATGEMADYAAEVRRLSNYEVWRNVESALLALAPGQESEETELLNLRILLEELKWRFSGLEGAGSVSDRVPAHLYPN